MMNHKPRVLILDDEEDLLELMKEELEDYGLEVVSARTGLEGLDVLAETSIDCILSDMTMPGMSGEAFLQAVRKREASKHTPFFFVTARVCTDDMQDCSALINGYIEKPIASEAAVAKIHLAINGDKK
ncbi:MAG: response regulator [Pseudobacteriovorax sp.]|nr:response regulator [Pseudobacteriovorax sp.]